MYNQNAKWVETEEWSKMVFTAIFTEGKFVLPEVEFVKFSNRFIKKLVGLERQNHLRVPFNLPSVTFLWAMYENLCPEQRALILDKDVNGTILRTAEKVVCHQADLEAMRDAHKRFQYITTEQYVYNVHDLNIDDIVFLSPKETSRLLKEFQGTTNGTSV